MRVQSVHIVHTLSQTFSGLPKSQSVVDNVDNL